MNVLVIGRGGREHSIVAKLAESKKINTLYIAPGNDGMSDKAVCVNIDETNIEGLVQFAKEKNIGLTFVGPENPLLLGIADRFEEHGLKIFAPRKDAAMLEGSKSFAKAFMKRHNIPTADYETFTDPEAAKAYIKAKGTPIVIKADGLAQGKGVVVAETLDEALDAIDAMMIDKTFADAGTKIVIEEYLEGREFSYIAFVYENNVFPMIPARDHKRAFDNDKGPNTGGMGSFAPVPDISEETLAYATEAILQKTADGMVAEGRPFTGILYAGLMMTKDGPKVIEFNTRFGDPETQVILPLLKNDLLQVLLDVLAGKDPQLAWEDETCVGVVLAANGYPSSYEKNLSIPTFKGDVFTIYAGVKRKEDHLVSNGGRVLLVGSKQPTIEAATEKVYQSMEAALRNHPGFFYRKDIAKL
ncbi:phosphoribosylamine--glycine ligase [Cerasibacillus quisquiliarum]|uniref:Phosphoribosylamine--glycine ligase n=1 Tax=Cerasibacillus quisquiliarum TaxID=227865 RepID=A0A511UUA8_9BACI|nr:phosphoribosylamine--glycine ligase [Cerasibacillus quisquiliarum]MBB5144941.1 phosphoribosylamine--glycine ligase [Cerasibacillus quisquiliarum]GEN30164.1 phosphoribosylamine--glycine ligase [Cerasibacillus quisquiliarum]